MLWMVILLAGFSLIAPPEVGQLRTWVNEAQNDHYDFTLKMKERGVEVLELHDLLAQTHGANGDSYSGGRAPHLSANPFVSGRVSVVMNVTTAPIETYQKNQLL